MNPSEKLDEIYRIMEAKYKKEQALKSMDFFLKTLDKNYITRTNGARKIAEDFSSYDLFNVLSDYAISKFILEKYPVTFTEEELTLIANDFNGQLEIHYKTAIEFFALYNAINPFFAYNALLSSKNIKPLLIELFIHDRYKKERRDFLLTAPIASIVTIKRNGKDKKYLMSRYATSKAAEQIKREDSEDFGYGK